MKFKLLIFLVFILNFCFSQNTLPKGFVYVESVIPSIQVELKYFSFENFIFRAGSILFAPTSEIIDFETLYLARATRAKFCEILTSEI